MTARETERVVLPDGSLCRVEPIDYCSSLIAREVDGETVWGQVFSRTDDHAGQVAAVLQGMAAHPENYRRWWLG